MTVGTNSDASFDLLSEYKEVLRNIINKADETAEIINLTEIGRIIHKERIKGVEIALQVLHALERAEILSKKLNEENL